MLVLGTVVDQEKHPGRRQALNEAVEERLSLRVDPVQVLEHQEQGLSLALPKQEALDRIEGTLTALGGIEGLPLGIVDWNVKEGEEGRHGRPQGLV